MVSQKGRGRTTVRKRVPREAGKLKLLEVIALKKDLPEHRLKAGDLGAIVEILDASSFYVEFVEPSGYTRALLVLSTKDVRKVKRGEMLAIRSAAP